VTDSLSSRREPRGQQTLETWEMKALRLAQERKQLAAAVGDDMTKVKRKDREAWQRKKAELEAHIKAVGHDA